MASLPSTSFETNMEKMETEEKLDTGYGYAVIFNHETFNQSINQREREGTEKDVIELKKVFEQFNIEVHVHEDLTLNRIKEEVKLLSNFDFTPYECFIIVILSHGKENNILYAHDWTYNLNDTIVNPIVNTNPSLEAKPKIFVIQACKGSMKQKSLMETDGPCDPQSSFPTLPISNMFFAFSTFEGFVSKRLPSSGGIFIQKFCKLLMKDGSTRPISTIMEQVTHELLNPKMNQVPMVQTTMSKPFLFGDIGKGKPIKKEIVTDKGYAVIFNHEIFHESLNQEQRQGTENDLIELEKVFKRFHIEVHVHQDFTLNKIQEEVKRLREFDFKPYKCFIIVVLSQEKENNILYAHNLHYNLNDTIVNSIVIENRTLEGKPKIFILEACKGFMVPTSFMETDDGVSQPSFPALPISDTYFAFSKYEGFVSDHITKTGGIFIQKFCKLLLQYGMSKSITTIMEKVTAELLKENRNQVPMVLSTLSEPFIFGDIGNEKSIMCINDLLDEMIAEIFSYLSLSDLKDANKVCKKWKYAFNHPRTQDKFMVVLNEQNLDGFLKKFHQGKFYNVYFDRINFTSYAGNMKFLKELMSNIQFLSFYRCEFTEYQLLLILQMTENLKILKIINWKWKSGPKISDNNWNLDILGNIKHFEFSYLNENNSNCFNELLKLMIGLKNFIVHKLTSFQLMPNDSSNYLCEYIESIASSLKSIELEGFMLNEIQNILKINNLKLEKFIINDKQKSVLINSIVKFQPSITHLEIVEIDENNNFIAICNGLQNLKFLKIVISINIDDNGIEKLWELKQLKSLWLECCRKMTTKGLINGLKVKNDNLQSLRLGELKSCEKLLEHIVTNFVYLRELDLWCESGITEMEIQNVWRNLRWLKKLVIECNELTVTDFAYKGKSIENESEINGCSIADVNGLEHLELRFKSNITILSLQEIAKLKRLVYLCADFSYSEIDVDNLNILSSCKALEHFRITLSDENFIPTREQHSLENQFRKMKGFYINYSTNSA